MYEFSIITFVPENYPKLGSGLWGSVLDYGDGTVIKLAKRFCAGIGDGAEKIEREFLVLKALAHRDKNKQEGSLTPLALDWGNIPDNTPAKRAGYDLYLRQTSLRGTPYMREEIASYPSKKSNALACEIAYALAMLHKQLLNIPCIKELGSYEQLFTLIADNFADDDEVIRQLQTLRTLWQNVASKNSQPIHGDFNISNLLFSHEKLVGIVDFAEAQLAFPEHDLAALVAELPGLEESLIHGYEVSSGSTVNRERLTLACKLQNFFSDLIAKRQKRFIL